MTVKFILNGQSIQVDQIDPHVTLLQWLRASGRTGTKEGCAEGECGACAVALVGRDAHGRTRYEPVNSCLVSLPTVHGRSVVTVEGVAESSGELHPVQKAMVEKGGSQCGYCTPGFVMSLFCEYYRPGRQGFDPEAIAGNLCRCTGYRPIADAARSLPSPGAGDRKLDVLAQPVPELDFAEHESDGRRFVRPTHLFEVTKYLARWPDAVLLAGGTDLMTAVNQRYERWPAMISLEGVAELRHFEAGPHEFCVGAGVTLSELEERLARDHQGEVPLLEQLLPLFSSRLIRNRATLGGNLATASPIGDSPPALLALDAEISLVGAKGERRVPLRQFFLDYRKTALQKGELIASVHFPRVGPELQRFYKVSKRVLDDISTVAGAFALSLDEAGRVTRFLVAYGGIAKTPVRAEEVEHLALGKPWTVGTLALLLQALTGFGTPMSDHRGSAAYRRAMTGKLLEKFFEETSAEREGRVSA